MADQLTVGDVQKAIEQISDWMRTIERVLGEMDPHQPIDMPKPPVAKKKNIGGGGGPLTCLTQDD